MKLSMLTLNFFGELSILVLDFPPTHAIGGLVSVRSRGGLLALHGRWPIGFADGFGSPPFSLF